MTYSGDDYMEFMEAFSKTYKNPERVFTPTSIEELENILDKIS